MKRVRTADPSRPASAPPLAYFITFHTYGTWLHGDARQSVDRNHNQIDTPRLPVSGARKEAKERLLAAPPAVLTLPERGAVDEAIQQVCAHKGWVIHALNVRTNHVHIVV